MDAVLEIRISGVNVTFTYGGDMERIAREIARVGLRHEPFAEALTEAVNGMNEERKAERLRDEMIGFIIPNK